MSCSAPTNPAARARRRTWASTTIIVHTGFDERNMIPGLSPLDDLEDVLAAVDIPVQAVGGLERASGD